MTEQCEVHVSDIRTFKACRLRWNWSSRLRGNLEPLLPSRPLFFGSAVHFALDAMIRWGPQEAIPGFNFWMIKLMDSLPAGYHEGKHWVRMTDDVELGAAMLDHYMLWAQTHDVGFKWLSGEYEHSFPIPDTNAVYKMTADGLLLKGSEAWVVEWKTCTRFPNPDELWRDEQNAMYTMGLQYERPDILPEGVPVVGTVYTFLRKKAPSTPRLKKDGSLSRARIDTSPELFRKVAESWGLSEMFYGDVLGRLEADEHKFFRRHWVRRTPESLTYAFENVVKTIREMLEPDVPIYPAPQWFKCDYCAYSAACLLVHNRADPSPLLEAEFRQRVPRLAYTDRRPSELLSEGKEV